MASWTRRVARLTIAVLVGPLLASTAGVTAEPALAAATSCHVGTTDYLYPGRYVASFTGTWGNQYGDEVVDGRMEMTVSAGGRGEGQDVTFGGTWSGSGQYRFADHMYLSWQLTAGTITGQASYLHGRLVADPYAPGEPPRVEMSAALSGSGEDSDMGGVSPVALDGSLVTEELLSTVATADPSCVGTTATLGQDATEFLYPVWTATSTWTQQPRLVFAMDGATQAEFDKERGELGARIDAALAASGENSEARVAKGQALMQAWLALADRRDCVAVETRQRIVKAYQALVGVPVSALRALKGPKIVTAEGAAVLARTTTLLEEWATLDKSFSLVAGGDVGDGCLPDASVVGRAVSDVAWRFVCWTDQCRAALWLDRQATLLGGPSLLPQIVASAAKEAAATLEQLQDTYRGLPPAAAKRLAARAVAADRASVRLGNPSTGAVRWVARHPCIARGTCRR